MNRPEKNGTQERSKRIGVLMGGWSDERDVSLKTGQAIAGALKSKGWLVIELDVDRAICERIKDENIDAAFLALHGRFGEDGTVQGMLEMMGIPYTGSGVLASSLAINKVFAKIVLQNSQIPTPPFAVLEERDEMVSDSPFGYPVVVKPSSQGSTIGTYIVKSRSELIPAISDAFKFDNQILMEAFIPGRELTVGILGEEALPVLEIVPHSGFYDFHAKYTHGETEYLCPAPMENDLSEKIRELALNAHRALGCRDFSRVDFRLREDGRPFCLEINTIPGMTDTSLLPKAARIQGIEFPDLVERILLMALFRDRNQVRDQDIMVS